MPRPACPQCKRVPEIREWPSGAAGIGCESQGCRETPIVRGNSRSRVEMAWQLYVAALTPPAPRTEKGTTGIPMKETTGLRWARDRTRAPVVMCIDDMSEPP